MNPLVQNGLGSGRSFADRRLAVRIQTDDPACLHVLNPVSPERFEVRVLDVSKGGFKLFAGQFFQRGTIVQIRVREIIAQGEVRYCVPARGRLGETGFHIGIQIEDVFSVPDVSA